MVGVCLLSRYRGLCFYEAGYTDLRSEHDAAHQRPERIRRADVSRRRRAVLCSQPLAKQRANAAQPPSRGNGSRPPRRGGAGYYWTDELRDYISVQSVANTETLVVSARHRGPQTAADMANAVADSFIEFNRELNRSELTAARAFIEEQLAVAEEQLLAAEQALQAYRETYGPVLPSDETRTILSRLGDLEARHLEAQLAHDDAVRRGHRAEAADACQRAWMRCSKKSSALEQRLAAVPEREMVVGRVAAGADGCWSRRLCCCGAATKMCVSPRRCARPMWPSSTRGAAATSRQPRPLLNFALAAFSGFFSGLGGVFVLEFFDTTVKSPEEMAQLLGLPVLGRIPKSGTLSERR